MDGVREFSRYVSWDDSCTAPIRRCSKCGRDLEHDPVVYALKIGMVCEGCFYLAEE